MVYLMIFRLQKIVFSANQLLFKKWKLDLPITKLCRYEFKAAIFHQEQLLIHDIRKKALR